MKLSLLATLLGSAAAFAPSSNVARPATSLANAKEAEFFEVGGEFFDPFGLGKMYQIEGSFPNMFPHPQFMNEADIKHWRGPAFGPPRWASTSPVRR